MLHCCYMDGGQSRIAVRPAPASARGTVPGARTLASSASPPRRTRLSDRSTSGGIKACRACRASQPRIAHGYLILLGSRSITKRILRYNVFAGFYIWALRLRLSASGSGSLSLRHARALSGDTYVNDWWDVYVYVYVYVHVHVHVHVCMYVCMYVCVGMHGWLHARRNERTACLCVCVCACRHCIHENLCTHRHTGIQNYLFYLIRTLCNRICCIAQRRMASCSAVCRTSEVWKSSCDRRDVTFSTLGVGFWASLASGLRWPHVHDDGRCCEDSVCHSLYVPLDSARYFGRGAFPSPKRSSVVIQIKTLI